MGWGLGLWGLSGGEGGREVEVVRGSEVGFGNAVRAEVVEDGEVVVVMLVGR